MSSTVISMEQRLTEVLHSTVTSHELSMMDFPEPRWAVPDLLPEGLALVAGKPKTGKSWLALQIASAVSSGGAVLGSILVERREVLYLALEDSNRRLRSRFDLIKAVPTDKLHFATAWRRGEEGLADLRLWLKSHPTAGLVIVDTLARIREPQVGGSDYLEDYAFMAGLKGIADAQRVTIVLIHHCRKMGASDYVDLVSGTTGIGGAADTVWVLQRPRNNPEATLSITGRDVIEKDLALRFEPEIGWALMGDAAEYKQSNERKDILRVLRDFPEGAGPREIAQLLEKNGSTVQNLLVKMEREGLIFKASYGKYLGSRIA